MITPRFYINSYSLNIGNFITDNEFTIQHIRALRLNIGSICVLFNGIENIEWHAKLTDINKKSVCFEILSKNIINRELPNSINLVQSLITQANLELIIEKTTELGIDNIYLVPASYSNINLKGENKEKKLQRFSKISISACEQCGRNTLPNLHNLESWQNCLNLLTQLPETSLKIFLSTDIANSNIINISDINTKNYTSIYYIIGAEGGFTDKEQSDLLSLGCIGVNLGHTILRAETASIAVLSYLNLMLK